MKPFDTENSPKSLLSDSNEVSAGVDEEVGVAVDAEADVAVC